MREVELVLRARISRAGVAAMIGLLEETRDCVWLSRRGRCERYTIRGVPGNECDVLLADGWGDPGDGWALVCDKSLKVGRFDGQIRVRYAVRLMPEQQVRDIPLRELGLTAGDGSVTVRLGDDAETFRRLKSDLADYDPRAIVMWHHARYYRHLTYEEASTVADSWVADEFNSGMESGWTLAEANRSASRALYRASREAGWRKYTLRERSLAGIPDDWGQWQRPELLGLTEAPE